MRPELFRLFEIGFPAYFTMLVTGFMFATLLGVLWALWLQRRLLGKNLGYLLASLRGYALGGRIEGRGGPEPRHVVLPTRLIVRESCGAAGPTHPAEFEDAFGRPPVHVADVQFSAR